MLTVLAEETWREREQAHRERADGLTRERRARQAAIAKGAARADPVDDFLYTYYPNKPAQLRRWHPGAGVRLDGDIDAQRAGWRWYADGGSRVDAAAFLTERAASVGYIESLLRRTAARPAQLGCFGLHEWAMVYRQNEGDRRHENAPLRLSQADTDSVVEAHRISCSHIDAFRFFTPDAVPRNHLAPTRENQPDLEQPGCLHANMDVYKWAVKLGPLVPGELLLDAFDLARRIRLLDMEASPYDLSASGVVPVRIETADGKARYAEKQARFADEANALRARVLEAVAIARRQGEPARGLPSTDARVAVPVITG